MNASPSLCRRCAATGATCCQGRAVFITLGDVARIRAAEPGADFFHIRHIAPDAYRSHLPYDTVWGRVLASESGVRILRHTESGDCHFLSESGCRLSLDARPLVCRLYPYDYNPATLKGVYGHVCPSPERENGSLLLALLGMNRDRAQGWRALLYNEIEQEFPG